MMGDGSTIESNLAAATGSVADVVARVTANDWLNADYKHMRLAAPDPAGLAKAGQFFNLDCPVTAHDKPFLRRPMSIYRADHHAASGSGAVEFLYKVTGAGTRGLALLGVGDSLRMLGPLGHGFELDGGWRGIVVVGRGVGLATLAPLAELAASRGVAVTAVISARSRELVMSVDRFAAIGAGIEVVLDSDGSSDPANVEQVLRRLSAAGRADAYFTCGSERLLRLLQRLSIELGIPGQVALEQQMACGLGMCFCCVRSFNTAEGVVHRRVCWDGPVFDLAEARP